MKRLFLLGVCLVIAGCSIVSHIPETTTLSGYDFRPFTERGFLFTPGDFAGRYESIGFVTLRFTPEANRVSRDDVPEDAQDRTRRVDGDVYWVYEAVDIDDLLETYYAEATELGANGVIHFRVEIGDASAAGISIPSYTLSGFAIKLLE